MVCNNEMLFVLVFIQIYDNGICTHDVQSLLSLILGKFGTRLAGGKDSASPRYIFTMLSPLAR